ncbi:MAG: penicillin-binding transpeptidase domain-containing protein, partial [Thermoanaerobaculia bacterium]
VWEPPAPRGERIVSERTAAILNEMLKQVVSHGTGTGAALADYVVAGKTGTAQKAVRGGYHPEKTVASFVGYAPADRPRVVILVVVDEPRGGAYGGTAAAPVFREIAEGALRYLDVVPALPRREIAIAPPARLAAFSQPEAASAPARAGAAASSDRVVIPDLRGMDARRAVEGATRAGLTVRLRGRGVVRSQEPPPGPAAPGTAIELTMAPLEELVP